MLLKFTFKNFRSFKDENILDMTATKVTELSYHVRKIGKEKMLPITAIYGANASGKTNVINALAFMRMCVIHSHLFDTKVNIEKLKYPYNDSIKFSFIDNNENAFSIFEVVFILPNKKRYIYGFKIDKKGFKEEWLQLIKSNNECSNIIIREDYKLTSYNTRQKDIRKNIAVSLSNTSLILSLGSVLKDNLLITIYNWFNSIDIIDFGIPVLDTIISKTIISSDLVTGKLKDTFLNYLSSFDKSIVDYSIEEYFNNDVGQTKYRIYTHHKIFNSNELKKLPLVAESSGTQKMIALFLHFYDAICNGYIILIDELNAKLHPLLVRLILNMFANPTTNPNNAQLIFTTHDSWLMKSNILRRDEIWFTEKDDNDISILYSLVEFKDNDGKIIRKDENYEKNYLLGKYGAVPQLSLFNFLDTNEKNDV